MGITDIIIGLLNAAFFIGAALSTIFAHRIVSSVGHIRSFSVFCAVFAIAALGHIMIDTLWIWGVLRIILGFCHYSLLLLVESWLSEKPMSIPEAKCLPLITLSSISPLF